MARSKLKIFFVATLIVVLIAIGAAALLGTYFYYRLTRDLPKIERLSDYKPMAVTSIYARDRKTLIAEVYEQRRYPVAFAEIPTRVKQAFLAAEDAAFYSHPGVDFTSILRALWVNLRKKGNVQGGSTITQQIVKALLLTREKTYERKAKEAILAYQLEQALTKDEIFSIYLNEIFLGNTAYGVKAAALVHFHKSLDELSLAEAAFLAGLPPKPSSLIDPKNRAEAVVRQRYALSQMEKNKFITAEERRQAEKAEIIIYPPQFETIFDVPYFATHVIRLLEQELGRELNHPGGYTVYTTVDPSVYRMAENAVIRGVREVDKRRGWRGPLARAKDNKTLSLLESPDLTALIPSKIYRALVVAVDRKAQVADVRVGTVEGRLSLKEAAWAQKLLGQEDHATYINLGTALLVGDVIEVSLKGEPPTDSEIPEFILDQTPELEGAFSIANALSGEVSAIIGGYDFKRSKFNRATQALRQPGSAFKPFVYLAAIDYLNFTPTTIVPDSPISMPSGDGTIWTPGNFDGKFLGPITFRSALERSRNVVSVYLLRRIGVDRLIDLVRRFGISTPIPRELSISLGSAEVIMIELVRAYGAFASGGWLADAIFFTEVRDRDGKLVIRHSPRQEKVIGEASAFVLANVMKGVVERGTATSLKQLNIPLAGKTGTTNDQMDAWFVGYTPEWTAGAWVGFDVKRTIGRMETGGKAAAPIFLYFMQEFMKDKVALDFNIPDGVTARPIYLGSGSAARPNTPGAFYEFFKSGTEPTDWSDGQSEPGLSSEQDYLSNDEF